MMARTCKWLGGEADGDFSPQVIMMRSRKDAEDGMNRGENEMAVMNLCLSETGEISCVDRQLREEKFHSGKEKRI